MSEASLPLLEIFLVDPQVSRAQEKEWLAMPMQALSQMQINLAKAILSILFPITEAGGLPLTSHF